MKQLFLMIIRLNYSRYITIFFKTKLVKNALFFVKFYLESYILCLDYKIFKKINQIVSSFRKKNFTFLFYQNENFFFKI